MVWHTHRHNKSGHFRGINLSNAVLLTVKNCKRSPKRGFKHLKIFRMCPVFLPSWCLELCARRFWSVYRQQGVASCCTKFSTFPVDRVATVSETSFLIRTVAPQCNMLWQFCARAFYVRSVITYTGVLKTDRGSSNPYFSRRAWCATRGVYQKHKSRWWEDTAVTKWVEWPNTHILRRIAARGSLLLQTYRKTL